MTPLGERSTATPSAPWRWWREWFLLLSLLASLCVLAAVSALRHEQDENAERQRVEQQVNLLHAQLELSADASFAPVVGLGALIQVDGSLSDERFRLYTQWALQRVPQLISIAIAPDDVVRHVYPVRGNESVQGLDYRSVPAQWQQIQAARHAHAPILAAPVNLVQGGAGVIQRYPVFVQSHRLQETPDTGAAFSERYWGVVSAVVDWARFIDMAGLRQAAEHLDLALTVDQGPDAGRLIWGVKGLDARQPIQQHVRMPGASWLLSGVPRQGWNHHGLQSLRSPEVLICAAAAFFINVLLFTLSRQGHLMRLRNAELNASQARFRSLAGMASDWVWEQDGQMRFTYVSRAAEEATDVASSGVLGHTRWEAKSMAPGIDWSAHQAQLARHEPFRDLEYAMVTEDGTLRHVSVSGDPVFDDKGRFSGYRGIGRNITAAKLAEQALRASRAELMAARDGLQSVLDAAIEVAIFATDMQGQITLFNKGAERMLGYSEAEMRGHSPDELRPDIQAQADRFVQMAQGHHETKGGTREWTLQRKDGCTLQASLSVSFVQSREGQAMGYLGIAIDVTARRQAEQDLRDLNQKLEARVKERTAELTETLQHLKDTQDGLLRSEKLAALGSMVAGVAHELNTPLGNCLTTASTLQDRTREVRRTFEGGQMRRSTLEGYFNEAGSASDILLRGLATATELVVHFKQLSVDQTSMQRRTYKLSEVVDDVQSLLRARWKTTPYELLIDVRVDTLLEGYPGPLGQVLSNLMLNALLHAFEGRDRGRLRIHAESEGDAGYVLTVEDDGQGMSEDVRRRAFDPFFTTKMGRGGTGLGLNIVHNLVTTVLGGRIVLHSEPGQGCRFDLHLPCVAPVCEEPPPLQMP